MEVATLLQQYHLQQPLQLIQIMIDTKLSESFKKMHLNQQPNNFISRILTFNSPPTESKQLASNHTYEELCHYFQLKHNLQETKLIIKHKITQSPIRTHQSRKKIWMYLSGAHQYLTNSPEYYPTLSQYHQYPDYYQKIIRADVQRTVDVKNPNQYENGAIKLQTVLQTYSRRNPYIGYCQGMNFIAHFLQLMQFKSQESFWILTSLIEDIIPRDYYTNMFGVAVDLKIILEIIQLSKPKIYCQMVKAKLDISIFMLEWLVCLFTTCLPFYLIKIVWDMLLVDGSCTLLKICLILFETLEDNILSSQDFSQLLQLVDKNKIKLEMTEEEFLTKVLSIHIDDEILNIARILYSYQVRQEKQSLVKNQPSLTFKQVERWKVTHCNLDWPICFQSIRKNKDETQEMETWTLRTHGSIKFISNYCQSINKYRFSRQALQPQDQLLIGRMPHICDMEKYSKNLPNTNKQIEMGMYEVSENGSDRFILKPEQDYNSSVSFYKRVTSGKFNYFGSIKHET